MAALSGAGAFIKTGAGTLAYNGDSSGYTGTTSISSGTLLIRHSNTNAALGSASRCRAAPRWPPWRVGRRRRDRPDGGFGRHGLARQCRHRHADGQGNLAFNDGARYSVQTDPTGSGLIHATGTAALDGGSVAQIPGNGYGLRSTYKILSADDGLSGTFGSVTSNFAFLDPKLTYDANNAYLTLTRNNISFTSNGLTRRTRTRPPAPWTASAAANNPLYDAVALLPMIRQPSTAPSISCPARSTLRRPSTGRRHYPDQRKLAEIAADWNVTLLEAARRSQPAGAVHHNMHEDDVRRVLSHPLTMVGSDGLNDPAASPAVGRFPRVLGHSAATPACC